MNYSVADCVPCEVPEHTAALLRVKRHLLQHTHTPCNKLQKCGHKNFNWHGSVDQHLKIAVAGRPGQWVLRH